jgi:hypothetical protein
MKPCFGCDNIICICSEEDRNWAIDHYPKEYKRYCEEDNYEV